MHVVEAYRELGFGVIFWWGPGVRAASGGVMVFAEGTRIRPDLIIM